MKYLITILLICSGLLSCTVFEGHTVESITIVKDGWYKYTTKNGTFYSKRLIYNVGDTIKFTK